MDRGFASNPSKNQWQITPDSSQSQNKYRAPLKGGEEIGRFAACQ
jgi:hypothetical protein